MTVLRHLAFWRHSENPRQSRLLRRAGNLLLITGGLVLAYPFWSSGYATIQQSRLSNAYNAEVKAFAPQLALNASSLNQPGRQEARVQALAKLFAHTLSPGKPVGRLKIPRIGLNSVILQGKSGGANLTSEADTPYLRSGPVHYGMTPLPGEGDPFAVAGHRTTYAAPFYSLDKMRPGDAIYVETPYARFTYTVAKTTIVDPNDTTVLIDRGYALVLTTCTPLYSAAHRLVVWGKLTSFAIRN
jgi:sortase A